MKLAQLQEARHIGIHPGVQWAIDKSKKAHKKGNRLYYSEKYPVQDLNAIIRDVERVQGARLQHTQDWDDQWDRAINFYDAWDHDTNDMFPISVMHYEQGKYSKGQRHKPWEEGVVVVYES